MFELTVPLSIALEERPGVFPGTGGLSIDEFVTQYVESGTALREWVQLWAEAQQALAAWAAIQEARRPDHPGP